MNSMIRWNPWREMRALQRAAQRVADGQLADSAWLERSPLDASLSGPPVDMYETDEQIVITATVPGLAPEDIDIKLVGNTLTIKGESKREQERKDRSYVYRERSYGSFARTFAVPDVVADQITAEMQNGVLTLTMQKSPANQARTITVQPK